MEYFSLLDSHYIAVAHVNNGESNIIDSAIWQWDMDLEQISLEHKFETIGALDWEYFSVEDDLFLVVANAYNGSSHNTVSMIYKVVF